MISIACGGFFRTIFSIGLFVHWVKQTRENSSPKLKA